MAGDSNVTQTDDTVLYTSQNGTIGDPQETIQLRTTENFTPGEYSVIHFATAQGGTTTVSNKDTVTLVEGTPLNLTANTTSVVQGGAVNFTVTRADNESTVNATVAFGGETGTTGSDGSVVLTATEAGNVTATASKEPEGGEAFLDDTITVSVEEPANITYGNIDVSPESVEIGSTVTANATVANVGGANGTFNATLFKEGTSVGDEFENGTLAPEETANVSFDTTLNELGTTNLSIGDAVREEARTDQVPVSVSSQTINLTLIPNETAVTSGTPVLFNVTNETDGAVADANVSVGNQTGTTDENGTVVLPVFGTGNVTATATKESTPEIGYNSDSVDIRILAPATVQYSNLSVAGSEGEDVVSVKAGTPVPVTVDVENTGDFDFEEPVEVTLQITQNEEIVDTANESVLLNESELTQVQFEYPFETGSYNVTIAGSGLDPVPVTATEQLIDLHLDANTTQPFNGTPVRFTVTNATEDGARIENATVTVGNNSGQTNDNGVAIVTVVGDGEINATATKATNETTAFNSDNLTLTVRQESNVVYGNLSVSPLFPTVGDQVTINATVTNDGLVEREYNGTVFVDGEPIEAEALGARNGTLGPGETAELNFTTSFETVGDDPERVITVGDAVRAGAVRTDPTSVFVQRQEVQLNITANTTEITAGEAVQFNVTYANDTDANATVSVAGQSDFTDSDGSVTFTLDDPGTFTATASKAQSPSTTFLSDTVDVTVNAPADIQVTDVAPLRTTIYTGDTLRVPVTVRNFGDEQGSKTLNFSFQGASEDQTVTLNGSETKTIEFSAPAKSVGSDRIVVNNEQYDRITVLPAVAATGFSHAPAVTVGDELSVTVEVENRGLTQNTRPINLTIDGETADSREVTLNRSETRTITLTYDTTGERIGTKETQVGTLATKTVDVTQESVGLQITTNATTPTITNETVAFNVTYANGTDADANVSVAGRTLQTGSDGTVTTSFDTPGTYTARASKPDTDTTDYTGDSTSVTVSEPANLSVVNAFAETGTAYVNDSVTTYAAVVNDGGVAGSIELELTNNTSDVALVNKTVRLSSGGSTLVELTTQFNETQDVTLEVNNVTAGDLTVEPQSVVTDVSFNATAVSAGGSVRVSAEVTNRGENPDSDGVNVTFVADETTKYNETGDIAAGNTVTVSETFTFEQNGTYPVTVEDEVVGDITVARNINQLDLTADDRSVTLGTPLEFTVTNETGTPVDAQLTIAGETYNVDDGTVTVPTDDPVFDRRDDFRATATKESDERFNYSSDSVSVRVIEPAAATVTNAYRQVTQAYTGDNVTIEADVSNPGDEQIKNATINLTAGEDGPSVASKNVTLDPGEQRTITLNATFETLGTRTLYVEGVEAGPVEIDPQSTVTGYTVTPTTVTVDNDVTVTATVENRGATRDDDGFTVNLSVGGQVVANNTSDPIDAGNNTTVTFTRTLDETGPTTVSVNDQPATNVLVNERLVDLSIDVEMSNPTSEDEVVFNVTNSTGGAVEDVSIAVGGQSLTTNENGIATAEPFDAGTYTATATKSTNDTTYNPDSATFTVRNPANVFVIDADVATAEPIYQGEPVAVDVTLLNLGGVEGTENVTLVAEDEVRNYSNVDVPAGSARTVTLTTQLNETGRTTLTTGDFAGQLDVDVQQAATVANYTVNTTALETDETLRVTANVTNRGGIEDSVDVNLTAGSNVTRNASVTVEPDEVRQQVFNVSFDTDGLKLVQVNDLPVTVVSVAPERIELNLTVESTTPVAAGQDITFRVREEATGAPVTDATVTIGDTQVTTGDSGTVRTSVRVSGTYGVTATKTAPGVAYERDTETITVTDPLSVPDRNEFGTVGADPAGDSSVTEDITITNDGGRAVSLSSATVAGEDPSQFAVTSQPPASVAPGETATVTVAFAPTDRGTQNATLRFRSDTPEKPIRTVELSGTGEAPGLSIDRSSVDFGDLPVDGSDTKTVEVTNTGNRTLEVPLSVGSVFTLSTDSLTVPPGESRTVDVIFDPDAAQAYGSRLVLASNDPFNNTVTIPVTGTGEAGELTVSPAPDDTGAVDLNLGSVTQGSTVTAQFLLVNTGTAELNVTPTITNDANDEFDITVDGADVNGTELEPLAPDESRFVTVSVTPTTADPTANITLVTESGSVDDERLDVAATTLTPTVDVVEPAGDDLAFGDVAVGGSTTEQVVIRNTGDATLEIETSGTNLSGTSFSVVRRPVRILPVLPGPGIGDFGQISIEPGETRAVSVRFAPTTPGTRTATLDLPTNAPSGEIKIDLQGTGETTSLVGDTSELSFGTVGQDATVSRTVTIRNAGTETLSNFGSSVTGSSAGQFVVDSATLPDSLEPGETETVEVTYDPSAAATHTATVTFSAFGETAGRAQFAVSLSGEATPPDIDVETGTVQFGYVDVGATPETRTISIDNVGRSNTTLDVADVSVTGGDTSAFNVTRAPETVPGNDSRTATVEFDPVTEGELTATLEIASNDPDEGTTEVTLVGVGAAPNATVQPGEIGFGQVPNGTTSAARTVTITNDGGSELTIDDVRTTGDDASQFDAGDPGSNILVPGASTTVPVAAAPTATGTLTANLSIETNGGDRTVELSATGVAPNLTIESDLNGRYGNVSVGSSTSRTFTIRNTGNATLVVDDPTISSGSSAFSVVSGDKEVRLGPDQTATYAVAFSPASQESVEGTLVLRTNEGDGEVYNLDLNGTGVDANASLSPSSIDFGDETVGTSNSTTATLANDGTASLQVTGVSVTGADAAAFSVSGLPTGEVAPGSSDSFTVRTSPSVTGSASAQLEIATANEGTLTASLGVTGVEQDVEIERGQITFEPTRLGTVRTTTLAINNTGNAPLNVSDLRIAGNYPDQFEIAPDSLGTIEPGGTKTVEVAFTPPTSDVEAAKSETVRTANLIVQSNDPDEGSVTVPLSGAGETAALRVTNAVQFGSTGVGDTSTRTVTIRNDVSASAPITLRSVFATGGIGNEYTVTQPGRNVLEPGESTTVTVSLTPQFPGPKYGSLNVITNDPRQPGASVFLSNSETIITVDFASVHLDYNNVDLGLQPERTFDQNLDSDAALTGIQPAVQTSGDFQLDFDGQPTPIGAAEQSQSFDAIRYISATKTNLTSSELTNNTFRFRVSKAAIADLQNVGPDDIKLYRYDGSEYVPVDGGTQRVGEDRTNYIYEATSTSLSQFAIVYGQPNLVAINPSLSATSIQNGSSVTVSVDVRNDGGIQGSTTISLTRNGTTVNSETVTLAPGASTTVELTFTPASTGTYDINIGGLNAGTLTVNPVPTQPPGGGGGGGGGGGAPPVLTATPAPGTSAPVSKVTQLDQTGAATVQLSGGAAPTSVSVNVPSTTGQVSVTELPSPPDDVPAPTGRYVTGVDIDAPDPPEGQTATVTVTIPQSRLDELGVSAQELVIQHYRDGAWQDLETDVSESGDQVTLSAPVTGFSPFAVTTREQVTATPETDTPTPEPETDTPTPEPETDTPTDTPQEPGGFGFLPVALVVIALLAAAGYLVYRQQN